MDLQLFAAQEEGRTLPPTERRIRLARARGHIAKSAEISPAIILIITTIVLFALKDKLIGMFTSYVEHTLQNLHLLSPPMEVLGKLGIYYLWLCVPLLLVAFLCALVGEMIQVGGLRFYPHAFIFNLLRLQSHAMRFVRRLLPSKLSLFEYSKTAIKVVAVFYISYVIIKPHFDDMVWLVDSDISGAMQFIFSLAYRLFLWVGIFFLVVALFDYWFQYHEYRQSLMMAPRELREEIKQYEGDPLVRFRQQRRMQEFSNLRRMLEEVTYADVVITNPTTLAVALRYDARRMRAPRLIAKGRDFLAERIVTVAKENNVVVVENRVLCEALYGIEVGNEIPPHLYKAVAEVLAYVYRVKRSR